MSGAVENYDLNLAIPEVVWGVLIIVGCVWAIVMLTLLIARSRTPR